MRSTSAAPVLQLRELLRRIALVSIPVALLQLTLLNRALLAKEVSMGALVLLGVLWAMRRNGTTWTLAEQFIEGLLLSAAGIACGSPVMVLAVFYTGVYYRALAEGPHAPLRAALTYQAIFLVALVVAHPHVDASLGRQLLSGIPGFGFGAVLMHALSRALQGQSVAQEQARDGETRFRMFVDTAHEGVVATDVIGQITYVNARACAVIGHRPDELLGKQVFAFMTPESSFEARTFFARRQLGHADLNEFAFRTGDGEERWTLCSSSPIPKDGDEFGGALLMITDITQRRAMERALVESHETLSTLVNAAPLAIVVINRDHLVSLWNPAAERLFGWTEQEVLGHPLPTVPVEEHGDFLEMRRREELGDELRAFEAQRRRKDGSSVHVLVSSSPLRSADGRLIGTIGLYADMTERHELESRLRQAQKMEAVGQLAGGVAHDFNNILTVIKGNASFLREGCPTCRAELPESVEIDDAASRAARLTSQLLAFSRKQVIRPQVVDVPAALERLASLLRRLVPENIEQRIHCDSDAGHVLIDPGQLEQIIMNLTVNARDAMPGGGAITIDVRRGMLGAGDSARFGGATIVAGPYVCLSITDTGSGMSTETMEHIFEPFFTTKPVGRGTGLGLATVYGVVKQNQGYIGVRSRLGTGTSVDVCLPLSHRPMTGELREIPPASVTAKETILVVEDEDAIRSIVERQLQQQGYRVFSARDGNSALEFARTNPEPMHLLLTDVILPGISGAALARELSRKQPDLRVLFMSGYTDDHIVLEGVLPPSTELLEKPFDVRQLLSRVRASLDKAVA